MTFGERSLLEKMLIKMPNVYRLSTARSVVLPNNWLPADLLSLADHSNALCVCGRALVPFSMQGGTSFLSWRLSF